MLNTGAIAAWTPIILTSHPEWKEKCREEVDGVLARKRQDPSQSISDVLDGLSLQEWETQFPVLQDCLREAIRVAMPGTLFRKNMTGKDVPIGNTGEVIPDGSFAAYLMDTVHMDPDIYPDPLRFDPGRYSEQAARPKKANEPHSYVGWGTGCHPCRKSSLRPTSVGLQS